MQKEGSIESRVLVCVSASPSNQRVIKSAARFAKGSGWPLTALYIDDGRNVEQKKAALKNLAMAREFGAETRTINRPDVLQAIMDYTREQAVTDLFIGYSGPSRGLTIRHLPVYQLVRQLPQVDIHIIPDALTGLKPSVLETGESANTSPKDLLTLVLVMATATGISVLFDRSTFSNSNIITVYILAVLITAALTAQRFYGILASVLYILLFNFLFIDPRFSFLVYDPNYLVTYLVSVIAAVITANISSKMKQVSMQASLNAYQAQVLLNASELLQRADGGEQIARILTEQLGELLGREVFFYPVQNHKLLRERCIPENHHPAEEGSPERDAERWTLQHNQRAGWGTRHSPEADCQYLSVRTAKDIYGLVGVASGKGNLNQFEENILLSLINECGLTLEAERNRKEREEAVIVAENERFRSKLLRSVSHDLRTPLTSISGNAANLCGHGEEFTDQEKDQIYRDIYEDSIWLIQMVENLLSITRLEEHVAIHPVGEVVSDVLATAVERVERHRSGYEICLEQDEECLVAWMDVPLILQVLENLIGNAVKHTPEGTRITVSDLRDGDHVIICVADSGPGIDEEDLPHIFELFYTGKEKREDAGRSLGLGLNLCRSILEAHGERIWAENIRPHGAAFYFSLKLWEEEENEAISYSDR